MIRATVASLIAALLATQLAGCGMKQAVSNYMSGEDNSVPPEPLVEFQPLVQVAEGWSTRLGKGADEQFLKLIPQVVNDRVYTAERRGRVAALDAASGKQIWEQDVDVPISGGPGIGDGLVLVGTTDGEVLALDEGGGKLLWRAPVTSEVLSAPQAAAGVVVVHTGDGKVNGLDAATGKRVWIHDRTSATLTLRGSSSPVVVRDLAIVGFDNGRLVALELKSGKPVWETAVAVASGRSDLERMVDIDAELLVRGETLYVATFQGRVAAIEIESGRLLWSREISSYAGLAADDHALYLTDSEGMVWSLDRDSGAAYWKQDKLKARASTAPAAVGEYVIVGDIEGYLHWLRREDGQFAARARIDSSRIIAPPVANGGILYAYSTSGVLAAFLTR